MQSVERLLLDAKGFLGKLRANKAGFEVGVRSLLPLMSSIVSKKDENTRNRESAVGLLIDAFEILESTDAGLWLGVIKLVAIVFANAEAGDKLSEEMCLGVSRLSRTAFSRFPDSAWVSLVAQDVLAVLGQVLHTLVAQLNEGRSIAIVKASLDAILTLLIGAGMQHRSTMAYFLPGLSACLCGHLIKGAQPISGARNVSGSSTAAALSCLSVILAISLNNKDTLVAAAELRRLSSAGTLREVARRLRTSRDEVPLQGGGNGASANPGVGVCVRNRLWLRETRARLSGLIGRAVGPETCVFFPVRARLALATLAPDVLVLCSESLAPESLLAWLESLFTCAGDSVPSVRACAYRASTRLGLHGVRGSAEPDGIAEELPDSSTERAAVFLSKLLAECGQYASPSKLFTSGTRIWTASLRRAVSQRLPASIQALGGGGGLTTSDAAKVKGTLRVIASYAQLCSASTEGSLSSLVTTLLSDPSLFGLFTRNLIRLATPAVGARIASGAPVDAIDAVAEEQSPTQRLSRARQRADTLFGGQRWAMFSERALFLEMVRLLELLGQRGLFGAVFDAVAPLAESDNEGQGVLPQCVTLVTYTLLGHVDVSMGAAGDVRSAAAEAVGSTVRWIIELVSRSRTGEKSWQEHEDSCLMHALAVTSGICAATSLDSEHPHFLLVSLCDVLRAGMGRTLSGREAARTALLFFCSDSLGPQLVPLADQVRQGTLSMEEYASLAIRILISHNVEFVLQSVLRQLRFHTALGSDLLLPLSVLGILADSSLLLARWGSTRIPLPPHVLFRPSALGHARALVATVTGILRCGNLGAVDERGLARALGLLCDTVIHEVECVVRNGGLVQGWDLSEGPESDEDEDDVFDQGLVDTVPRPLVKSLVVILEQCLDVTRHYLGSTEARIRSEFLLLMEKCIRAMSSLGTRWGTVRLVQVFHHLWPHLRARLRDEDVICLGEAYAALGAFVAASPDFAGVHAKEIIIPSVCYVIRNRLYLPSERRPSVSHFGVSGARRRDGCPLYADSKKSELPATRQTVHDRLIGKMLSFVEVLSENAADVLFGDLESCNVIGYCLYFCGRGIPVQFRDRGIWLLRKLISSYVRLYARRAELAWEDSQIRPSQEGKQKYQATFEPGDLAAHLGTVCSTCYDYSEQLRRMATGEAVNKEGTSFFGSVLLVTEDLRPLDDGGVFRTTHVDENYAIDSSMPVGPIQRLIVETSRGRQRRAFDPFFYYGALVLPEEANQIMMGYEDSWVKGYLRGTR